MTISKRPTKAFIAGIAASAAVIAGTAVPAAAVSDSSQAGLPNTGAVIQANVYLCNVWQSSCSFRTSAKALRNGSGYTVRLIRNTADFNHVGVGSVSVGAVTVSGGSNPRNLVWTNSNTWISDHSGKASATWAVVALGLCSGAYAEVAGVRASSNACVGA